MAEIKFVKMRFRDAGALRAAVEAYFERVASRPEVAIQVGRSVVMRAIPPTPAGLARALGVSTPTMYKYMRGEVQFPDSVKPGVQEEILRIITEARMRIEEEISERALVGSVDNAVSRQILGAFGYNKCMDDSGEEANNKVMVIVKSANDAEIESWAK
jgi:hypothetical protein